MMVRVNKTVKGDGSIDEDQRSGAEGVRAPGLRARIAVALGVGAMSVVFGACGGAASSSTTKAAATGMPSATASPRASTSTAPTGVGLYPTIDTPVASAPSAMGFAWLNLAISKTIPGSDIFSKAPQMPTVINKTNGAVSAVDAQAVVAALWREETLLQWAQAHDENGFMFNTLLGTQESNVLLPDAQAALAEGGTVIDPNCDIFPVSVTLWPHTAGVDAWLTDANEQTAAPIVAVVPFHEANCRLTITVHGKTSTEVADLQESHGVDPVLWVGEVVDDPTVGPYFKLEASTSCLRPKAVPAMCG
jgi:hypothetical protein